MIFTEFFLGETIQYIEDNCLMNVPMQLELINCNHKVKLPKAGFIQIIQNLISNSKKFTNQPEVFVSIAFEEDDQQYFLTYEDDGPGIPEKYWEKAFVMFETLGNESYKNSGIGLATIKSVLERIGGTIRLKNNPNKKSGVCFEIKIPKKNPNLLVS
jgi:signal transduction histidine kinase